MSFDAISALREAGVLDAGTTPTLEVLYANLTQEETEILISAKDRIKAVLPDVVAHSHDWASPEAAREGFDATMMCACGAWSGSGAGK